MRAAQLVTRDTNGDGQLDQWGIQLPYTNLSEGYAMFAWTLGGAPADYKGMKFTLTSPQFREAAQFVHDLVARQRLVVTDEETAQLRQAGVRDAFVGGKVAFFLRASPNVGRRCKDVGSSFEWDIAPFPARDARRPGVALSSGNPNIGWSGTKAPDEVYAWMRFLAGPETQGSFARTRLYTPALKSRLEGLRGRPAGSTSAASPTSTAAPTESTSTTTTRCPRRALRRGDEARLRRLQEPRRRPAGRRAADEPAGGLRRVPALQGAWTCRSGRRDGSPCTGGL